MTLYTFFSEVGQDLSRFLSANHFVFARLDLGGVVMVEADTELAEVAA
jgi:hypothetical protein